MYKSKLNESHIQAILGLKDQGLSVPQIAQKMAVSNETMYSFIKKHRMFEIKQVMLDEVKQQLIQYRKDGLSLGDMSAKTGYSTGAI